LIRTEPWFPLDAEGEESIKAWNSINSIEKRAHLLADWILSGKTPQGDIFMSYDTSDTSIKRSDLGKENIRNFLEKKPQIKKIIENSLLSNKNKVKFSNWLEVNSTTLRKASEVIN
jgi:hypothetical protein